MITRAIPPRRVTRLWRAVRRSANWYQLGRFLIVGSSGFVVNVGTFAVLLRAFAADYRLAAVAGFVLSLINNFYWNRLWTFDARSGARRSQAMRFVLVFVSASSVNFVLLGLLVGEAGLAKVVSEIIASGAVAPGSFLANRLWVFRASARSRAPSPVRSPHRL